MDLFQYYEYCFGVKCRFCKRKTLDPDKVKGQKWLNATCSSCGNNPAHTPRKSEIASTSETSLEEKPRSWWNYR
jgi:hypothetical protein